MDKNRRSRHYGLSRYLISGFPLLGIVMASCVLLQSCNGDLSHSTLRDIEWEKSEWERDSRALDRTAKLMEAEIAASPKLFEGTSGPEQWRAKLAEAKNRLAQSERDNRRLGEIARSNRASSQAEAERLLMEARELRQRAVSETQTVEASVSKWRHFAANPQAAVTSIDQNLAAIRSVDLRALTATVEKAENDWPSKKTDLAARLSALEGLEKTAGTKPNPSEVVREQASGGVLTGPSVAALISLDDDLAHTRTSLASGTQELADLSSQLYI